MMYEQEREWLESRGLSVAYDWKDAAEFEARVAEKLVTNFCFKCPDEQECCPEAFEYPKKTIKSCRVMHARLAVEAEMDKGE